MTGFKFQYLKCLHGVKVPPNHYRVLVTLLDYANEDGTKAYPGIDNLARDCCVSESTVKRALTWLAREGWIHEDRRGCTGRNSEYSLHIPAQVTHDLKPNALQVTGDLKPDGLQVKSESTTGQINSTTGHLTPVLQVTHDLPPDPLPDPFTPDPSPKDRPGFADMKKENEEPKGKTEMSKLEDLTDDFLKVYPKQGNRVVVREAIRLELNKHGLSVAPVLLKSARAYAADVERKRKEPDYIKRPENFLKNDYYRSVTIPKTAQEKWQTAYDNADARFPSRDTGCLEFNGSRMYGGNEDDNAAKPWSEYEQLSSGEQNEWDTENRRRYIAQSARFAGVELNISTHA